MELSSERSCGFSICQYIVYWDCAEVVCNWNPIIEYEHSDPAAATENPAISKETPIKLVDRTTTEIGSRIVTTGTS
jgi:hypothetical protein